MYMSFMSDWLMMVVLCIQTLRERGENEWEREMIIYFLLFEKMKIMNGSMEVWIRVYGLH